MSEMNSRAGSWALFLIFLGPAASGQNVVMPNKSGQCTDDFMPFESACIRTSALEKNGVESVLAEHEKFLADNRAGIGAVQREATICQTTIDDDDDDVLELSNGAIVEVTSGYLGYIGLRPDTLMMLIDGRWKIAVQGERELVNVDILREPSSCSAPSTFPVQAAVRETTFIINDETFEAQTLCLGWAQGDRVFFLEGSQYGACATATLLNTTRGKVCRVWCE